MGETSQIKRKPSAIPGITGIVLVVFMLGLFATSLLGFHALTKSFVEGSSIDVYLKDSAGRKEAEMLMASLKSNPNIKQIKLVDPATGLKELKGKADADLMEFVDPSILPFGLELYFHAESATPAILQKTVSQLKANHLIESVVYNQQMLTTVQRNLRNIQLGLGIMAALFIIIAIGLINSSIRLNIFASRFLIKSMQLVGATSGFIVWPFVWKFIKYAFLAIPLAAILLFGTLQLLPLVLPDAALLSDFVYMIDLRLALPVFVLIALLGIIIAAMSAWFSTLKYLRTKIENLY